MWTSLPSLISDGARRSALLPRVRFWVIPQSQFFRLWLEDIFGDRNLWSPVDLSLTSLSLSSVVISSASPGPSDKIIVGYKRDQPPLTCILWPELYDPLTTQLRTWASVLYEFPTTGRGRRLHLVTWPTLTSGLGTNTDFPLGAPGLVTLELTRLPVNWSRIPVIITTIFPINIVISCLFKIIRRILNLCNQGVEKCKSIRFALL